MIDRIEVGDWERKRIKVEEHRDAVRKSDKVQSLVLKDSGPTTCCIFI